MLQIRLRGDDPVQPEPGGAVPVADGRDSERGQPIASGGYRYCIACGGFLDSPVPFNGRPVCSGCEAAKRSRRRGVRAGLAADLTAAGRRARLFFYAAVVLAALVSAYFGYRLAVGSTTAVVVSGSGALETAPDPADRT